MEQTGESELEDSGQTLEARGEEEGLVQIRVLARLAAALCFPSCDSLEPGDAPDRRADNVGVCLGDVTLAERDVVVRLDSGTYRLNIRALNASSADGASSSSGREGTERVAAASHLAYTQFEYAQMLLSRGRATDQTRATTLLSNALDSAEHLRLRPLAAEIQALTASLPADPRAREQGLAAVPLDLGRQAAVFRLEGEYWSIEFAGVPIRMKDAKGLRYLHTLLVNPGRELHVLDLVAQGSATTGRTSPGRAPEGPVRRLGDAGEILDPQAKATYRARIRDLRHDIEEAEARNDLEVASRFRAELDFLIQELADALGLAGRNRTAASAGERARSSVSKSLRSAIRRIGDAHQSLGAHLLATVQTGYYCSYCPDPRVPASWQPRCGSPT